MGCLACPLHYNMTYGVGISPGTETMHTHIRERPEGTGASSLQIPVPTQSPPSSHTRGGLNRHLTGDTQITLSCGIRTKSRCFQPPKVYVSLMPSAHRSLAAALRHTSCRPVGDHDCCSVLCSGHCWWSQQRREKMWKTTRGS